MDNTLSGYPSSIIQICTLKLKELDRIFASRMSVLCNRSSCLILTILKIMFMLKLYHAMCCYVQWYVSFAFFISTGFGSRWNFVCYVLVNVIKKRWTKCWALAFRGDSRRRHWIFKVFSKGKIIIYVPKDSYIIILQINIYLWQHF